MSLKPVKISAETYEKVKELAEKSGKSIREVIEEAINVFLLGKQSSVDKDIKKITSKIIVNRFNTKCYKCKKELKEGDMVYYVKIEYEDGSKRSFVYCLDCYYESEALANYYLKKKQLESIIKGLKKRADKLVEEIEKLKTEYDIYNILREVRSVSNMLVEYMRYTNTSDTRLEEAVDKLDYLAQKISELMIALRELVNVKHTSTRSIRVRSD